MKIIFIKASFASQTPMISKFDLNVFSDDIDDYLCIECDDDWDDDWDEKCDYDDFLEEEPKQNDIKLTDITHIVIVFEDLTSKQIKLEMLSDSEQGSDFLQRFENNTDFYKWTYNHTMISKSFFKTYLIEEKVKSILNLAYDASTKTDILDITNFSLMIDHETAFSLMDDYIEDLSRLPQLKQVSINFFTCF